MIQTTDAPAPISTGETGPLKPVPAGVRDVYVLVNPASGGVGPNAAAEVDAILAGYDVTARVVTLDGPRIPEQIAEALQARPDVLFVLAGDGTARSVASRAGPDGPLIVPLPGGTMNMLPKALYGTGDWQRALERALDEGVAQPVAGGEVDGEAFYCAAIMGSPALWAPAREAVREGRIRLAYLYARRALRRAFSGRIRFALDDAVREKAEALVLISPMISRAVDENIGLEAAVMKTARTSDAVRLAAHALFTDWRRDPSVETRLTRHVIIVSRANIPAVIDGEPMNLGREARVRFVPRAFMALAPDRSDEETGV
ncbi:diacylglycerol/lipid kinase family protein [Brevundimonas vesicularis]|uniref:diacylglycerol/lipid kinase family protein n=1 Tax=Brevundimonas vesicularis TaxID=41276 RepID=UPI0038D42041